MPRYEICPGNIELVAISLWRQFAWNAKIRFFASRVSGSGWTKMNIKIVYRKQMFLHHLVNKCNCFFKLTLHWQNNLGKQYLCIKMSIAVRKYSHFRFQESWKLMGTPRCTQVDANLKWRWVSFMDFSLWYILIYFPFRKKWTTDEKWSDRFQPAQILGNCIVLQTNLTWKTFLKQSAGMRWIGSGARSMIPR